MDFLYIQHLFTTSLYDNKHIPDVNINNSRKVILYPDFKKKTISVKFLVIII